MKRISLIIAFILIFSSMQVFANVYNHPSNLSTISTQIPKMRSIKCKFRQEKYLQNISKPIVSYGKFEFIENKGVYFYTLYPVQSTTNYTNKNYSQINDLIKALSSKKYTKLEKEFLFFYEGNINNWSLGMKPKKNSNAYNFISYITINGTDYIHKINIQQVNGNKTVLWFTK